MNAQAFLELVKQMRAAQKTYFKQRSPMNLFIAKDWEKKVDQILAAGLDHDTEAEVAVQLTFTEKENDNEQP